MKFVKKSGSRYCYKLDNKFNINVLACHLSKKAPYLSLLKSNAYYDNHQSDYFFNKYEYVFGYSSKKEHIISSLEDLDKYYLENKDWLLGHFSYDLKNKLHRLKSDNINRIPFSDICFFIPEVVVYKSAEGVFAESLTPLSNNSLVFDNKDEGVYSKKTSSISFNPQISKAEYLETVKKLQNHIQIGDIYEVNFCQDFYSENTDIKPFNVFQSLIEKSPTPFSSFYKENDCYLMSASPERFLVKRANKLISQPIKGTSKLDSKGDITSQIRDLKENIKERSENVMIVDLVRNDLSETAIQSSVKVEELFGIYPFQHVLQMISTVSSELKKGTQLSDILISSFPMGSMTGAPKKRAMSLIEKYERFKRGLFSGSVGYISPDGDFDFNVIIRSILYDKSSKMLSVPVGSAVTIMSDPESEYEECLLKIESIRSVLDSF